MQCNMSSLSLIADTYSCSNDEDEEPGEAKKRPKMTLQLPESVRGMFKAEEDALKPLNDEPGFHRGRKRSFPHLRGNWATFAFIKFDQDFDELQNELAKRFHDKAEKIEDPHLSLTKVVALRHHWIDDFVNSARKSAAFAPFSVSVAGLKAFANEEKSRTFIAISLKSPKLNETAKKLDEILGEFNLPKFYDPPEFHASLLWVLGDQKERIQAQLDEIDLDEVLESCDIESVWKADRMRCKCGNKVFNI